MNTDNNNTSLEERVLKNIEEKKIAPYSRAYFIARNLGMWVLATLALVLGGFVISGIFFRLHNMGMVLPPDMDMPSPPLFLHLIPLLWIFFVALFTYLAYREVRATDTGYRYTLSTIVFALVGGSTVLGFVFSTVGGGRALDNFMDTYVPFHERMEELQERSWLMPERGLIVGTLEGREGYTFVVRTRGGEQWTIEEGDTLPPGIFSVLLPSTTVGVRGVLLNKESHTFRACDLRPLVLRERTFMKERMERHEDEQEDDEHEKFAYERKFPRGRSIECEARTASNTTSD